jgi:hypothetical membrane protein
MPVSFWSIEKALMTKVYLSRILSFGGIIAPPVLIIIIVVAGLLTPGYNQLTDTVSSLSDQASATPGLMNAGFFVYGALIIGFAYALYLRLRHGLKAHIAWFFLTLYGVCMILAGVFRDSPGVLNTEGTLHNAAIITSCLSLLIGMWMFAGSVYKRPSWFGFTWFTIGASFLGLLLSIIFLVQSQVPLAGLLQRFFYCLILLWIEIVSIWLFKLTFKSSGL